MEVGGTIFKRLASWGQQRLHDEVLSNLQCVLVTEVCFDVVCHSVPRRAECYYE